MKLIKRQSSIAEKSPMEFLAVRPAADQNAAQQPAPTVPEADPSDKPATVVTEMDGADKPMPVVTEAEAPDNPATVVTEMDGADKPMPVVTEAEAPDNPATVVTEMDGADKPAPVTELASFQQTVLSRRELSELQQPATIVPRSVNSHREPPSEDRLTALWRAKYVIVLVTVLVWVTVYLISSGISPVYSSSALISVTAASTPGGSAQDVALASNDLAAQDAEIVKADSVLSQASKALGVAPSTLASHLSSGTVNAQNIVQITVQSSNTGDVQRWANGVAVALKAYLTQRGVANSTSLQNSVNSQAAPLNQQIAALQSAIAAAPVTATGGALAEIESEESQLTELLGTRATLEESTALAIASQQPNVDILQSASTASKVSPRPVLYASIAAIAALLVSGQLAIVMARRRRSTVRRP